MKNSQTESVDDKKYIVLIIYDITDNKTRKNGRLSGEVWRTRAKIGF